MLLGMSTLVPVSGTTKRSHRSGCAAAVVDVRMMVNAIATRRLGFISFLPQGSIALAELRSARYHAAKPPDQRKEPAHGAVPAREPLANLFGSRSLKCRLRLRSGAR